MYFPARLEQLFESETHHERSRHLVGIGILWIALGVMYALVVRLGPASTDALSVNNLRLAVVTPILIAVTFTIWWGVRPFTRELLMMLANIVAPVMSVSATIIQRYHLRSSTGVSRKK